MDGQTIGKKILRVRIANRDGGRARLTSIILLRTVPFWILSIIANAALKLEESEAFLYNPALSVILSVCALICSLILLADILFVFRRDRRTLHDMLAGTIVIMK
jgi:uncharacterized RDD family membrane protein YckC